MTAPPTAHNNKLDRKNSKSNKASKSKLKRDDDSIEHRSSKKKIMNKWYFLMHLCLYKIFLLINIFIIRNLYI